MGARIASRPASPDRRTLPHVTGDARGGHVAFVAVRFLPSSKLAYAWPLTLALLAGAVFAALGACGGQAISPAPDAGALITPTVDASIPDSPVATGDAAEGMPPDATAPDAGLDGTFDAPPDVAHSPPPCSAFTCPGGCCSGNTCLTGQAQQACGFGGQACSDCTALGGDCSPSTNDAGGACGPVPPSDGGPFPCGPANCAGCCAAGFCLPGTAPDACGSHGLACGACTAANESCTALGGGGAGGGACVGSGSSCSPSTCAGCCDGSGQCQDPVAIGACGSGGLACQFCLPGQACNSGVCQQAPGCGPWNCAGCCVGTTCLSGSTDNASCGSGGAQCGACTSGTACYPNGAKNGGTCKIQNQSPCGTSNCNGCCDSFGVCQPGNSNSYCKGAFDAGSAGQCGTCGGDCSTGTCVGGSVCYAGTCNGGCCMPDGTCWSGGPDPTHCGNSDGLCVDCGPGFLCTTSQGPALCTIPCSPQNCQGCCVGGVCSTGTDPTSCGAGGDLCVTCASGQSCVGGTCIALTQCGSTLCAGCCDANDVCHTGTGDTACGTGGLACHDCATSSQTCKGGVCQ